MDERVLQAKKKGGKGRGERRKAIRLASRMEWKVETKKTKMKRESISRQRVRFAQLWTLKREKSESRVSHVTREEISPTHDKRVNSRSLIPAGSLLAGSLLADKLLAGNRLPGSL